jgi:hypothetical protein
LASTYGPSVTAGTPSRTRTVELLDGSARAAKPISSPESLVAAWKASCALKTASRSSSDRVSNISGFM